MSKNFNSNTENKDEWLTPPEIITALGDFDLDPCAPEPDKRPWSMAAQHFSKTDNGLLKEWHGRVWCNPPYGRKTFDWIRKLHHHGNGIALIFARTETVGFHQEIWDKADGVFFFKGRLRFFHVSGEKGGTANAPSCLVAYGSSNVNALESCGLRGKLITLNC